MPSDIVNGFRAARQARGGDLWAGLTPEPSPEEQMEDRITTAMRRTNQVIGLDMGWNECEPSKATVREIVSDSNYLEQFGRDLEAVKAYRAMAIPERRRIQRVAFP